MNIQIYKEVSKKQPLRIGALLLVGSLLSACGGDDDKDLPKPVPMMDSYSYKVEVTNLTNNQPLSPVLISLNDGRFMPWTAGGAASIALEKFAEGGDNSELLAMAQGVDNGSYTTATADGALGAGASGAWTLDFEIEEGSQAKVHLSLATMLVNSNDAFSGVASWSLDGLAVGEYIRASYAAWDAGTEMNSELSGSIPGPADGGTGFSATRDDVNFVHVHPGIISSDDGLADSVLNASHKFDNPVLRIKVTRLQ